MSTFRLFWVFKKDAGTVRKKASHVLKKLFFFQNLLNFFQKSSIVRAKQLQIFGKFMFFRFFFFIKLDPCSRRESNRFFHTNLAPTVSVKQEKISLKLIKLWRFLTLSGKKVDSVVAWFFVALWYLKTLFIGHKTKTIFWKKSLK